MAGNNVIELLLWVTCLDCGKKRRCLPSCFVCRYCLGMNGAIGGSAVDRKKGAGKRA